MSAPVSDIADVNITSTTVGLTGPDFGTGMLPSYNATFPERRRVYSSEAAVAVDFPVATSPERVHARAYFSQGVKPRQFKIGRCANKPTLTYTISVTTLRNAYQYKVDVAGQGFTAETRTAVATDGSATNDEVVALLVTALNGVSGKNYTAAATGSVGSQVVTVTGDATGNWFSLAVNPADLSLRNTTADPGLAADLAAIAVEDSQWLVILNSFNSKAIIDVIAAYAAANDKIFMAETNDTLAITGTPGAGGNDVADTLLSSSNKNVGLCYTGKAGEFRQTVAAGRYLPSTPGQYVLHGKTSFTGVTADSLTDTHRSNLRAKRCSYYEDVAGVPFYWHGFASSSGWFVDMTRNDLWVQSEVQLALVRLIAANNVVPFTPDGATAAEGVVRGVGKRAETNGVYRQGTFAVEVQDVDDVSDQDRVDRNFPGITFTARRAGAMQKFQPVTGNITV